MTNPKFKGIYILVTKGPEYRVAGSSEIERCSLGIYDDKTSNWLPDWKFINQTFEGYPFQNKEDAIEFARGWIHWLELKGHDPLPDGIQFLSTWKDLQYATLIKTPTKA